MNSKIFTKISSKNLPLIFVTAMRFESRALLDVFNFKIILKQGRLRLYQLRNFQVFILQVGMGVRAGEEEIKEQIRSLKPALLINYGICGALDPALNSMEMFIIDKVCAAGEPSILINEQIPKDLISISKAFPNSSLLTVNKSVLNVKKRQNIFHESGCALTDMEAYYIAGSARELSITLIILKLISDQADENTAIHITKNLQQLKRTLRESLIRLINLL